MSLKGKTALITGGDSGIGRAAANMFAREGCSGISITYLPEEEADAQDVKKQIEQTGAKVNLIKGDLMDSSHCKAVIDSHLKEFGKLNILVNNASKQMYESIPLKYDPLLIFCRICKEFADIDIDKVESTFRELRGLDGCLFPVAKIQP